MKALFTTCILILFVSLCYARQDQQYITLIGEGDDIFMSFHDEYLTPHKFRFTRDSVSGELHHVRVPANHPMSLKLNKYMSQYQLDAFPGDTIYIKSEDKGPLPYTYSGRRKHELNFFNYLDQKRLGIGLPDTYGIDKRTPKFPSKVKRFQDMHRQRLRLLNKLNDSLSFSPFAYAAAKAEIDGQYFQALLSPYWDQEHTFRHYEEDYPAIVRASGVEQYLTQHEFVASSATYRAVAQGYTRFLSRDVLDTPKEFAAIYKHAINSLHGKTRDQVQFHLLKKSMEQGLPAYKRYFKRYSRESGYKAYVQHLDSLNRRLEELAFNKSLLNVKLQTSTGKQISWKKLLKQNQGQVIYVDLWASWCMPCLAEMPASKELQEKLRGRNVSFIYISIDDDSKKWEESVKENALIGEGSQHYLLSRDSDLAKFFNVPPIPRYLIIDKWGRAFSLNAKRPSNKSLVNDFYNLLL